MSITANQQIPEEFKPFAVVSDQILYVSENVRSDPRIQSVYSRLKKMEEISELKVASIREISDISQNQRAGAASDEQSKVIRAAKALFAEAALQRASDVHIRTLNGSAEVYFRVLGSMKLHADWPENHALSVCATIYGAMCDVADSTYNKTAYQDARIAAKEYLAPGLHGIRVAAGPTVHGTNMVLRLLYDDSGIQATGSAERLSRLGYNDTHIKLISSMIRRPSGINIVAGPTGSGKSTTLKHILEAIAYEHPEKNILTVEDPPEYPIRGSVQMPVTNADTDAKRGAAFGAAIRAALRMDPDIIMIGEIRDRESAKLALQAAMTGHQVWTTLHTNSAFGIISRLVELLTTPEMPNPINLIADPTVLSGLVFQRLVKTLCPTCKERFDMTGPNLPLDLASRVAETVPSEQLSSVYIRKKVPDCPECGGFGSSGRTVLSEVVATTEELNRKLRKTDIDEAKDFWIRKLRGQTIMNHAIDKIGDGVIDPISTEAIVGDLELPQKAFESEQPSSVDVENFLDFQQSGSN